MPTFEIPDGPTSVSLDAAGGDPKAPREGSAVFTVKNTSTAPYAGQLSVQVAGASKKEWFDVEGDDERNFAPGESQTATIKISVPSDVAAGDYPFRLRVAAVNDPDNDHAEGPMTTAKVSGPIVDGGGIPIWVWIVGGLILLAAVVGGVWYLLHDGDEVVDEQKNEVVSREGEVPNFVGSTLADAKSASQGYELDEVAGAVSGQPPNTITDQLPKARSPLTRGGIVRVTYDPGVAVPPLSEKDVAQAVRELQSVPLHIRTLTTRCQAGGLPDRIIDWTPKSPPNVAGNSGVDVVVRIIGRNFRGGKAGVLLGKRVLCSHKVNVHRASVVNPGIVPGQ